MANIRRGRPAAHNRRRGTRGRGPGMDYTPAPPRPPTQSAPAGVTTNRTMHNASATEQACRQYTLPVDNQFGSQAEGLMNCDAFTEAFFAEQFNSEDATTPTNTADYMAHDGTTPAAADHGNDQTGPSSAVGNNTVSGFNNETRPFIVPCGKNSFIPPSVVRYILPKCVKEDYKDHWEGIKMADHDTLDRWFFRFGQCCRWDPNHTPQIEGCFFAKAGELIRNHLYLMRKVNHTPPFLTPEGKLRLLHVFECSERFKKISAVNKVNARGEKSGRGHSRHRNGPNHTHWHADMIAKEKKRPAQALELYKRLRMTKDGQYLNRDGADIVARVEEKQRLYFEEHPDAAEIDPAEDVTSFASVVGTNERTGLPRVLGTAATAIPDTQFTTTGSQPSVTSMLPPNVVHELRETIHVEVQSSVQATFGQMFKDLAERDRMMQQTLESIRELAASLRGGNAGPSQ